jgi:hypothetical protein
LEEGGGEEEMIRHTSTPMLPRDKKLLDYSALGPKVYKDRLSHVSKEYHWGYYDGELNGMCRVDGVRLWFVCFDEEIIGIDHADGIDPEEAVIRLFHAIELTEDQRKLVDFWHDQFSKYVEHGKREDYDKFYIPYKECSQLLPIAPEQAAGWFTNCDFVRG